MKSENQVNRKEKKEKKREREIKDSAELERNVFQNTTSYVHEQKINSF